MNPQEWRTVREVFEAALLVEPDRQAAWLAEQCGSEKQLHDAVWRLLQGHQVATQFLDRVQDSLAPFPSSDLAGRRVGAYQLLDLIGSGGMGVVYRASRADEAFEKTVAIKLLGFRYAIPESEKAFYQERQILATLDHPHIARLLDGGSTPEGLLYLVMELVDGEPIDAWCQQRALPIDARLGLLEDVCSAVDHAHRNLIVHRDLKPKNILVARDGQVKLLDFGIAKVLSQSGSPGETLAGVLTPQYASPEQLLGKPITTASDIYSLGAVLYELLTDGARPYEVTGSTEEIIAAVCHNDPPLPSAAAPPRYAAALRGELDNIVRKAMAKDPARRYSSVEQLREDIRRYRAGLPVLAEGDRLSYRFRKFVGRRRALVGAAALLAISLAGGVASTWYEARMARHQRNIAEKRYNDVRSLATTVLFDIHDSIKNLAGSTAARKLAIDKGLQYLEALEPNAEGDVTLEAELAAGYERAGSLLGNLYDSNTEGGKAAAPVLQKALHLRKDVVGRRPDDAGAYAALAMSMMLYGNTQAATGDFPGAIARYREGLAVVPPALAGEPVWLRARTQILSQLCTTYPVIGDAPAAIPVCQESIAVVEKLTMADPRDTDMKHLLAMDESRLANVLRLSGRDAEALPHFRVALEQIAELIRQNPSDANLRHSAATSKIYLANSLNSLGDPSTLDAYTDAVRSLEESLAGSLNDTRRVMVLAYADGKYSELLRAAKRPAEAEASYERGLALYRQMAVKPASGANELNNYASALAKCPFPRLKNPPLALELAQRANDLTQGRTPLILDTLAWAYYQNGRVEEALRTDRAALSMLPAAQGAATGMRQEIEKSIAQFEPAVRR